MKSNDPASRRQVLKALTWALPGAALAGKSLDAGAAPPADAATSAPPAPAGAAAGAEHPAWRFFNADEAALVDALVARLIPADELGPGAREAGVTAYIDGQLAGAWGAGEQLYRAGPFAQGTPQQGYQLSYTPAEMFRAGLSRLDAAVRKSYGGKSYTELDGPTQDAVLTQMEAGKLDFSPLPAATFFSALMDATIEGFFSDPIYGGNKDMVGWKLVQFPGAYASYSNDIERHGVALVRAPVSIADGPMHDMRMPAMRMPAMPMPAAPAVPATKGPTTKEAP